MSFDGTRAVKPLVERSLAAIVFLIVAFVAGTWTAAAQPALPGLQPDQTLDTSAPPAPSLQLVQLRYALLRLPLAAGLAAVLALRPRRRHMPARQPSVIQTQIILAIVGAVVMLVVGSSLARAFGIVGAAGLVRYRAKISDPKDAGVMLSTLAIGLASGVGAWMLAVFAMIFILAVLWAIESFEKPRLIFLLTVKAKNPTTLKPQIEQILSRSRLQFELRAMSEEELAYELKWPAEKKTDRLSNAIIALGPEGAVAVDWDQKKAKE